MKKILYVPITILLFIVGCSENPSMSETELALLALIDADEAMGLDGLGSNGDMDPDHEVGLETGGVAKIYSDTLSFGEGYRLRFGRRITDRDRTVEFDVDGDVAIGLITYTITGDFITKAIDTSNHEQIDSLSFSKEFESMFSRKVRFVQVEDANNPDGYRWQVDALTPMTGGAGDKVSIATLSIYALNDSMEQGDLLYHFEADGLGDLFMDRDSLPSFTAFSKYIIESSVENTGPELIMDSTGVAEWVLKNYGLHRQMRGRKYLNDKGVFLDAVMNDNIHTGGWRAHGPGFGQRRGVFRSFVEVIDLATIFVSDGGYNTHVWSIPYRVVRP